MLLLPLIPMTFTVLVRDPGRRQAEQPAWQPLTPSGPWMQAYEDTEHTRQGAHFFRRNNILYVPFGVFYVLIYLRL